MELRIFDKQLQPLGIVDEAASLIWSPTYWQQGAYDDVKILAPITDNNKGLLVTGNIVTLHGEPAEYTDASGDWRRAMEITYKYITKDENGVEQIEVQGCFLKKWLSKRILINSITALATNQNIINRLILENFGEQAAATRQFANFTMLAQEDFGGVAVEYSGAFGADLAQEIYDRALSSKLGYDILINERTKLYGFWLYKGKDLTATNKQGNTPCTFSRDFDNVNEQEYTESIENMKNIAYVTGAAMADEESPPTTIVYTDEPIGIDRDELYIDAADISRSTTNEAGKAQTIPLDQYLELLTTKGSGELEQYGEKISFTSTINASQNVQFRKDFDIGDIVTSVEKRWNIKIDARITEVTLTYQGGEKTIEVTFGDSIPTLIEQIKKVRK